MDWKTTEELYADLLEAESEAQSFINYAYKAQAEEKRQAHLAQTAFDMAHWKNSEARELKAELLKRANAAKVSK